MPFKFEQLDVWQLSLAYSDLIYDIAEKLSDSERFNLKSQITRAATSISLNIDIQINSFCAKPDRFHYARINRGSVRKNLLG